VELHAKQADGAQRDPHHCTFGPTLKSTTKRFGYVVEHGRVS